MYMRVIYLFACNLFIRVKFIYLFFIFYALKIISHFLNLNYQSINYHTKI